jgi:hypothetical protein
LELKEAAVLAVWIKEAAVLAVWIKEAAVLVVWIKEAAVLVVWIKEPAVPLNWKSSKNLLKKPPVLVLQKPSRNHQFSQEKVPKNQQFYSRLFDGFFEIFENCGYISDSVLRFWDPTPWILSMPFPLLLPFFSLLKLCLPIIHSPKTLNPFLALQLFFLLHVHSVPFSAYTLLASTCLFLWFLQLCVCVSNDLVYKTFSLMFSSCSLLPKTL